VFAEGTGGNLPQATMAYNDIQFRKDQMDLLRIDNIIVYYLICVRRIKKLMYVIPYELDVLLYRVRA